MLVAKCLACHGPEKTKGGYQLHTFDHLLKPGDSKAAPITAGQPAQSHLFALLTTKDADDRMPQKDDPLPAASIALVERWIREGAHFDGTNRLTPLATMLPPTAHPNPPERYDRPVPVLAIAFHPGGRELAIGGYHEVTFWNPTDGTLLRRIHNLAQQTQALRYSPDGILLAVAGGAPGRSGEVKLINAARGTITHTLATTTDMALALAFRPDGAQLVSGGADNVIRFFDVATGRETRRIEPHADWVTSLAFSADGTQLASASRDKSVRLHDANTGELEQTYMGHGEPVFGVAFSPDGKQVFSSARDKEIHLWQGSDAKKIHELKGYSGEALKLLTQGDRLYSCGTDRQARLFKMEGKKTELLRTFSGHRDFVYALAVHAPTQRLATGSYDGEVRVWNTDTGELLRAFIAAPGYVALSAK